jgi:SnoaL-like protein
MGDEPWREVADRLEITELLSRYAHAIDAMDWDLLATVFTEDVVADFSSVGQYVEMDATINGFEPLVAWYEVALAPFQGVMHFMTNHLIDLDGDRARTRSYMHVLNMSMGGVYHADCVRTPAGWRISYFRLEERRWAEVVARLEGHMDAVDHSETA